MTQKNSIGLIPKPYQPGKFCLIADLSAQLGFSVNDGITSAWCWLEYTSVDWAARLVAQCGKGALMAKTDLLSTYKHVSDHSSDIHLLGIEWGVKPTVTKPCRLGFVLPRISSPQLLMVWPGLCNMKGSLTWCTTWTTSCCGVRRGRLSARKHWPGTHLFLLG